MKKKRVMVIGVLLFVALGVMIYVFVNNTFNIPYNHKESKVLTLSDFSSLEKGTSLEDVIETFGEPSRDIGLGLLIYVYFVEDGQMVIINFSQDEKVSKCTLQKKDGSKKILYGE